MISGGSNRFQNPKTPAYSKKYLAPKYNLEPLELSLPRSLFCSVPNLIHQSLRILIFRGSYHVLLALLSRSPLIPILSMLYSQHFPNPTLLYFLLLPRWSPKDSQKSPTHVPELNLRSLCIVEVRGDCESKRRKED